MSNHNDQALPPRKIRTTEPIADTEMVIHPAGTVATYYGKGRFGGYDYRVEGADAILWSLMPMQYEAHPNDGWNGHETCDAPSSCAHAQWAMG